MNLTLSVVDDASEEAMALRALLLDHGKFETVEHDGHKYTGICKWVPNGVEQLVGQMPGLDGFQIAMHFFRRNTTEDPVESWIHADGGIGRMAVVWYLSPDKGATGGTAFFRHKQTGWEAMPTLEQLQEADLTSEEAAKMLYEQSHEEKYWERLMIVPHRFNRMIAYPGGRFHGKYPKEGFGKTAQDARLIYVAFLV